jgi:hypothetical protein
MNYGLLKSLVADESHRADLTAQIPGFITRAEAMIARKLRAVEMLTSVTLADADRVSADSAIYTLPEGFLEERCVATTERELQKVGLASLIRYQQAGSVLVYAMRGANIAPRIEFRATPAADAEIAVEYFARPAALADDADTNQLLELHESVYLHAALFALYSWTQDLELAQAAFDTWLEAVETLNEQAGRYLGGAALTPAYNLGHTPVGGGY